MAVVKVKVIGPFEVAGIKPGDSGLVDDERVRVQPLVDSELVEIVPDPPEERPAAKKAAAKKGDA